MLVTFFDDAGYAFDVHRLYKATSPIQPCDALDVHSSLPTRKITTTLFLVSTHHPVLS